jgi:hypothetical protein
MVAVASQQSKFPTEIQRLLLDSRLHQAVIALQEVRLIAALREANLPKDQWLAHEQGRRAEAEAARQQTTRILEHITEFWVALDRNCRLTSPTVTGQRLPQDLQRTWVGIVGQTMEGICQEIVELIPPAWQHPDITCGRIRLAGHSFATPNF